MLNYMLVMIKSFIGDDEGASAIEYGLIIGLIAVILIIVLGLIGTDLRALFQGVADGIPAVGGGT